VSIFIGSGSRISLRAATALLAALSIATPCTADLSVPPAEETSILDTAFGTFPYAVLNTLPGFGLGSWVQGRTRAGRVLTVADALAWGMMLPGIFILNESKDPSSVNPAFPVLLIGGYVLYAASRVAGAAVPFYGSFTDGYDRDSVTAPIFYNLLPGFGLGSNFQGDRKGSMVLRTLDSTAFMALGILSGAALGGYRDATAVSGIAFIGLFGTSRIYGVLRPLAYRGEIRRAAAPR
jgi:hypothetical protein